MQIMEMRDYEQLEIDTRPELTQAISRLATDATDTIAQMISHCHESHPPVRNRHEAYGVAAQHVSGIQAHVKSMKNDLGTLLGTLGDPNFPAVEACSSLRNDIATLAAAALTASAEMDRVLQALYRFENSDDPTPIEALAEDDFEEADDE